MPRNSHCYTSVVPTEHCSSRAAPQPFTHGLACSQTLIWRSCRSCALRSAGSARGRWGFLTRGQNKNNVWSFSKKTKHHSSKLGTETRKKRCFVNTFCTQAYFYIKTYEYVHLYTQRTIHKGTNTHTLRTKCFLLYTQTEMERAIPTCHKDVVIKTPQPLLRA